MKTQSFVDVKYQVSQSHSIGYCRCIIVIILVFYFVNIAKLRNMLPVSDAEKLVHAFMTSRLDYCNALLGGCPASSINKLQIVQNAAARVLTKSRKYDHITQFCSLCTGYLLSSVSVTKYYYLPIKALNGLAPAYLTSLLSRYNPSRS